MWHLKREIPLACGTLKVDLAQSYPFKLGLLGQNGVGKSSFFQFLKEEQKGLFAGKQVSFVDQLPIKGLGKVRPIDFFSVLDHRFPARRQYHSLEDYPLVSVLGFGAKLKTPISMLSGGKNQVLKLLSAWYLKTDLYLFDEPSNFLDPKRLQNLIDWIQADRGGSYFIVDHRLRFIEHCCDCFWGMVKASDEDVLIKSIAGDLNQFVETHYGH